MTNIYTEPYQKFPKLHKLELRGAEGMKVSLVNPPTDPYYAIATGQSASWRPWNKGFQIDEMIELLEGLVAGKVWAGQAFESINFTFLIENISRACTHQLVRIRIGAGFMQESGREGVWHKAPFITPLTVLENDLWHAAYVDSYEAQAKLYEGMIGSGIPPQDARFAIPHAVAQNIWMTINFASLLNWCSKRLCTTMQWEINTLARMVRDEVLLKFPHLGVMLKSNCERLGGCKSITDHYKPGAENNGNKVYYPHEGFLCGKIGALTESEIGELLKDELERMASI